MNHPRAKQIRLPFSVPRPGTTSPPKRICGICRKRESKYACPRCNIAYCSLDCFRDQTHVQCSEGFYRETVRESIETDSKSSLEERKGMLEMLKRFEEGQEGDEDVLGVMERDGEEDEGDEDELERALRDVDLDDIDSNKLFHLLPPSHRDKFLSTLRNPESDQARALAEAAASSSTPSGPSVLPWWEDNDVLDDEQAEEEAGHYAALPSIDDAVLQGVTPPAGTGGRLAYNAIAITLAYLHTLLSSRLPSLSQTYLDEQDIEAAEIKEEIGHLVPFLVDAKSTLRYGSAREAWSAVWEAVGKDIDPPPPTYTLLRLLKILPHLLHPPIVTDAHPKILCILSDMYRLFSKPKAGAAIPRKLIFYISALRSLDRSAWLRLEEELESEIRKLEGEVGDNEDIGGEVDRGHPLA